MTCNGRHNTSGQNSHVYFEPSALPRQKFFTRRLSGDGYAVPLLLWGRLR